MSQFDNRKRSYVWNSFLIDNENELYVRCTLCGMRLYRGPTKTTTGMIRHLKLTHNIDDNDDYKIPDDNNNNTNRKRIKTNEYNSQYSINPVNMARIPAKERMEQIKLSLSVLCAVEAVPLDFISSSAFHSFCSISSGDICAILPNSDQIHDNIVLISERVKQNVYFNL